MKSNLSIIAMLFISFMYLGCRKLQRNCDQYYINKMQKVWETVSDCSPDYYYYLGKGSYRSTTVYFTSTECSLCFVAPPSKVVNCAGDSITVENWRDVKDVKTIATCRNL